VRIEEFDLRRVHERGRMEDAGGNLVELLERFPEVIDDAGGHPQCDVPRGGMAGGPAYLELAGGAVKG